MKRMTARILWAVCIVGTITGGYAKRVTMQAARVTEKVAAKQAAEDEHFAVREASVEIIPGPDEKPEGYERGSAKTAPKDSVQEVQPNPAEGEKAFAAQIRAGKARRSYADFLRKFAVIREEARLDPEEFDVGYYSYGLTLYGRMPLIEPLETKESCKIQDFVIVIDTSYSTSGELVEGFLKETSAVLSGKDMFFGTCSIRVIQCDDKVRADQTILAGEGINSLPDGLSVVGGGGTDFRPAFSYVEKLREAGELKHLKGLLYFTDGKGTYPVKKPDYKTAFLFLGDYEESAVPPWAMRLRLEPEEWMK